jgi:hypothetical protein
VPAIEIERQLIWSSLEPNFWVVLVYKQTDVREACFPAMADSSRPCGRIFIATAVTEQRIRNLEACRLKMTGGKTIH